MSRVRPDSSRSVSASRSGVIDPLAALPGAVTLKLPDFKTPSSHRLSLATSTVAWKSELSPFKEH
jgi:hypothetical protein